MRSTCRAGWAPGGRLVLPAHSSFGVASKLAVAQGATRAATGVQLVQLTVPVLPGQTQQQVAALMSASLSASSADGGERGHWWAPRASFMQGMAFSPLR